MWVLWWESKQFRRYSGRVSVGITGAATDTFTARIKGEYTAYQRWFRLLGVFGIRVKPPACVLGGIELLLGASATGFVAGDNTCPCMAWGTDSVNEIHQIHTCIEFRSLKIYNCINIKRLCDSTSLYSTCTSPKRFQFWKMIQERGRYPRKGEWAD